MVVGLQPFLTLHGFFFCLLLMYKGSFLVAEVMAAKGYKVQPVCRVPRHDVVQVCL